MPNLPEHSAARLSEHRAEAALRESEERLRLAIDAGQVGTWDWDIARDHVTWSDRIYQFHGLEPGRFGGSVKDFTDLIHPEDRERVKAAIEAAMENRQPYRIEMRAVQPGGEVRWISTSGAVIFDGEGRPVRMLGATVDITEAKLAEQALRESEEHLRMAQQVGHIGSFEWNEADDDAQWSPELRELYGMPDDYKGNLIEWAREHVHPDDLPRVEETVARHLETRTPMDVEFRILRPDGSVRWIYSRADFVSNSTGSAQRLFGITIDITGRKQAEEEREQLLAREQRTREMAESANRMKDEFLATLSHELRTPLNAIIGWADMLLKQPPDPSILTHALKVIHRNARTQAQLIEDMLDVSRIITGKFHLDIRPLEILPTVGAAIDSIRPVAEDKGIRVEKAFDFSAGEVLGDPTRLQQVVWNLLSNAVKFTERGGKIEVRVERVGSEVEIIVSDTGKGMRADLLPYIFDRFRQADSSYTRRHTGLGLGLAIVRHLTELHGGTVEAYSAGEGEGSKFKVRLPLMAVRPASVETIPDGNNLSAESGKHVLEGLRILLVDDHADTRDMLSVVLETSGAEIKTSTSAGEAFEMLKSWRPDILISDIGMPDEDGYSLIRRIRNLVPEQGGATPALALTGYAGLEEGERALSAGYQLRLAKPVEPSKLMIALIRLAGRVVSSKNA